MSKNKRIILITIIILIGLGTYFISNNYYSRKEECNYVNTNYNCGIYDCSIIGYFFNHNLCRD